MSPAGQRYKKKRHMPNLCPYRIVLADDDALYRLVVKRILEENPDLEVSGEAGDGLELLSLLAVTKSAPQMAIVDISMGCLGGIETTSRIKGSYPGMRVLILSIHREKEYVLGALAAGADGYLLKEDADTELLAAIRKIRQGSVFVSSHLAETAVPE